MPDRGDQDAKREGGGLSDDAEHPIEPETDYLILRSQEGDRESLERLFERYASRTRQIAALRMGRPVSSLGTVDDIVQEALLRALRNLGSFQVRTEGRFRNYVARCVESAIVDAVRARQEEVCESDIPDFDLAAIVEGSQPTPSAVARERELQERIEAKLLEMKPHDRELIILRRLCGMSYAEISRELGLGEEVKARVYCSRALRKLEGALAG